MIVLLAYLGGVLTILSPCILPVLPFVFARADRPFVRSGLPLLAGMAVSFAAIASLAAIGGSWAVEANRIGRATVVVAPRLEPPQRRGRIGNTRTEAGSERERRADFIA